MTAVAPTRVRSHRFGWTRDGREVRRFELSSPGMTVGVLDYGAVLHSLEVPDAEGRSADVVLGYDDAASYETDPFYMGAIVGRHAGRIAGAAFDLDGLRFRLTANEGTLHLHGGTRGFGKASWRATPLERGDAVGIELWHTSPDGDEGYPGTLGVRVTYSLTATGVLAIDYCATTDRATPVNLTQHAYFDLSGGAAPDACGHELSIDADRFAPLRHDLLPVGALAPLAGTPLDFRESRRLCERIDVAHAQLGFVGGYDHYFARAQPDGTLARVARLADPATGRTLEVWTTEPGLQLYSGNFLDGRPGKRGRRNVRRAGVCLETQGYPDAPNQPGFPTTVLRPGEERRSRTEFRFFPPRA